MAFTLPSWLSGSKTTKPTNYLATGGTKPTSATTNYIATAGTKPSLPSYLTRTPVLDASTTQSNVNTKAAPSPTPTTPGDTTQLVGNGAGTGAAATFNKNGMIAALQKKWSDLGSVLNDIYGTIDGVVTDRANSLNQNYATQEDQLAKDFGNVSGQTSSAYAGRGLADSSYLGQAQDANQATYDTTLNGLTQDKQSKYAELGQYAQNQKAGVDAVRSQYEPVMGQLNNYDEAGLNSVDSNLNTSLATAHQQRAGLGTDGQFIQKLNAITPVQQQGSAQLQARLQNLIASTAPATAKRQIAKGLIKAATLSDPNQADYWNTQFETLLANGGQ